MPSTACGRNGANGGKSVDQARDTEFEGVRRGPFVFVFRLPSASGMLGTVVQFDWVRLALPLKLPSVAPSSSIAAESGEWTPCLRSA